MRGQLVSRTWQHDPTLYAPPKYRRACGYDAFIPDLIGAIDVSLGGDALASMSEADDRAPWGGGVGPIPM